MNQWNRVSRHLALDSREREERRSIEQSGRVISSGRAWIEIAAVERLYRRGTRIQELFLGNGHAIRTKCLEALADTLRECSLRERARRRVTTFVQA